MQELILRNASEEEMFTSARKNGFISLHEDAIIKALRHEIPYEEMNTFSSKISEVAEDEDYVDNSESATTNTDIMVSNEDSSH